MPWTALHGTAAYLDMARSLEEAPDGACCAVTFVPVLLDQLEAFAGGAPDRLLELALRPAADLSEAEAAFVTRHFFSVRRDRRIDPQPRYRELLALREAGDRPLSESELTDLQVLFSLAWFGPTARRVRPEVADVASCERGFSEEHKAVLDRARRALVAGLLPRWRELVTAGRVEPVTVPYHHPILPLLLDSDVARRCQPDRPVPPRFSWPDDARWQVERAVARHEQAFGSPPVGVWPAEGSVSPEAAALLAGAGLRWAATDEEVLARSLAPDGAAPADARNRVWRLPEADDLRLLFRDHDLSDRIGFSYASLPAQAAVDDLVARARAAPGDDPIVVIALDGENPWEAFERDGEEFRARLYGALAADPELEPVTPVALLDEPASPLPRLHTGSWIGADFRIWIGDEEENRAWAALGEARRAVAEAERAGHPRAAEALELLRPAEGSDWFWWYGDDFVIEQGALFDELFRARLLSACALVDAPPPALAERPIRTRTPAVAAGDFEPPKRLIHPPIDGRFGPVTAWWGAGVARRRPGQGTMATGPGRIAALRFGYDLEALYVRVEPVPEGFSAPLRLRVGREGGRELTLEPGEASPPGTAVAQEDVLEASVPFSALEASPGDLLVVGVERVESGVVVERVPGGRGVRVTVPDRDAARRLWQV